MNTFYHFSMPSIVQAINDFKFEATPSDVLNYLKAREIRKTHSPSDDHVLDNSKFLNVFREDDAVSKIINNLAPKDELIYPYAYICRLVNHRKHIPWLFKDGYDWMSSLEHTKQKMQEFVGLGDTVCNPGAYQINPRIGFKYGHRNIRDSLLYVIPNRMEYVVDAFKSTDQIDVATDRANDAFGGFTNFWMFQAALDIAWLRPDLMDRNSKPYFGSGSKQTVIDEDVMMEYLNTNKPTGWRDFYPFDVENAICEFRKYRMRQAIGIPNNRKYNSNLTLF